MSLTQLENPLTRLTLFPNTMNYRGVWSNTVQYYENDVVINGFDSATYILTGKTTLLGGATPQANPDWETIGSAGGGSVQSVTAPLPLGLENIGTPQVVVLANKGVISITTNTLDGIENIGTAQNQQLVNTGVLSVTTSGPTSGITITGPSNNPVLANAGVISLATSGPTSGITLGGTGQNPIISNDGVLSLTASTGISITAGQTPTIANTGVLVVTASNGCVNTGTPTAPNIEATGIVASCTTPAFPANGGQIIGGTAVDPVFSWEALATGVASFGPSDVTVTITLPFNLSPTPTIMLTAVQLAGPTFFAVTVAYQVVFPNQFIILIGRLPSSVGVAGDVQWVVLKA
jgi:hypothetical protein